MNAAVRTTCPYCGVGCGVLMESVDEQWQVRGDPAHPANRGALCSKGSALAETIGTTGRFLEPRLDGAVVDWPTALDAVADGFRSVIERHGPDSVALYVSGQFLTEDYYVANKLMKGFIGSANIDTNSRLCMSSAVAAHKRAFGEDLVPVTYADLELADLIVLVGSNTAWCHPVLYQRIVRAKSQRPAMRLVVIDPRRTPTCDIADLHVPLRAGTDVMLFNGLLSWLARNNRIAATFIADHTRGFRQTLMTADNTAATLESVARSCGVELPVLQRFYEWFGATERTVTAFSQGVNQSNAGTDKGSAIINVHLATGRLGRPGMGPFSITGQPNAMGGREVGGMANTLAAHMEFDNESHRDLIADFWGAPRMAARPGLKAVDLFEAVHEGHIKALWIMATNPIVSMPNANRARTALQRCELLVVSECSALSDTLALARIQLPAMTWGEKDGTVTNSDRHISRQRAFLKASGNARPDWWIVCEVAKRLGFVDGFNFDNAGQIFDEHARLSSTGNDGTRAFDIGGLAGLGPAGYDQLAPIPWPVHSRGSSGTLRLFEDARFYHDDRRARLVPTRPRPPSHPLDRDYPLLLNTGRIRDQWHTMTRTGQSQRLSAHLPEPFVDMHPADALGFGLGTGGLVRVETRWGRLTARLRCSGEMARGSIFVPIHWSDANASDARVGALVSPTVDPDSGEPDFKATPARVEAFVVSWYGILFARKPVNLNGLTWWSHATAAEFHRYEIAGREVPRSWASWAQGLVRATPAVDWIEYTDSNAGMYRAASFHDGRLDACIFISSRPSLPSRSWLAAQFDKATLTPLERSSLLAGRPADSSLDDGETVCSCFSVGIKTIEKAILEGCRDVPSIGKRLKAGTNCGSCIPELRRILQMQSVQAG